MKALLEATPKVGKLKEKPKHGKTGSSGNVLGTKLNVLGANVFDGKFNFLKHQLIFGGPTEIFVSVGDKLLFLSKETPGKTHRVEIDEYRDDPADTATGKRYKARLAGTSYDEERTV